MNEWFSRVRSHLLRQSDSCWTLFQKVSLVMMEGKPIVNMLCYTRLRVLIAFVGCGVVVACGGGGDGPSDNGGRSGSAQATATTSLSSHLVRWEAPATMADGSILVGLTGFKIYGSRTRYDLSPILLMTLNDPAAKSAIVPGLALGAWYFWVSATAVVSESELQYVTTAVVQ